ncbi:MAG: PEP-CTERM sorting domain-containing protein [Verrucomicrobiota bacterium]
MKTVKTISILLAACSMTGSAYAQTTILVDFDDGTSGGGHDATIRDGDFGNSSNNNDIPANTTWEMINPLATTVPNGQLRTNNNSGIGTDTNAIIGWQNQPSSNPWLFGQDTGWILAAGDTFEVSYMMRAAANWGSSDTVDFQLFYTDDNTLNGARTNVYTLTSTGATTSYQTFSSGGFVAGQNLGGLTIVDGKNLFVGVTGYSVDVAQNEFGRFDNVYVAATAVPEPSSYALLAGIFGFFSICLRRR